MLKHQGVERPVRVPAPPRTRRVVLERSWVVGVVLFTLGRFVVAYGALDSYGVNIWLFGFIDLITAVPYGVSTARLVGALVDRSYESIAGWAAVASGSFLAPYLYLAWAGRDVGFPPIVYVVLGVLAISFGTYAVYGIGKKVRLGRAVDIPSSPPI